MSNLEKIYRHPLDQMVCLLHYLAQEANALDMKAFFSNLAENDTDCTEEMMTFAEQLKQEGRQEGHQEGRIEIARNLLLMGMDFDTIAQATGLDNTEIETLMAAEV